MCSVPLPHSSGLLQAWLSVVREQQCGRLSHLTVLQIPRLANHSPICISAAAVLGHSTLQGALVKLPFLQDTSTDVRVSSTLAHKNTLLDSEAPSESSFHQQLPAEIQSHPHAVHGLLTRAIGPHEARVALILTQVRVQPPLWPPPLCSACVTFTSLGLSKMLTLSTPGPSVGDIFQAHCGLWSTFEMLE